MSECLNEEISLFCSSDVIENIYINYEKIVGIESNLNIINEHNKCVGKVILISNTKNISLNSFVEFNRDKIKWRSSKLDSDENGFYLVDPYWCKKYISEPKIDVPIKVYKPTTNTFEIELMGMYYKQFLKRRLLDLYGDWKYRVVAAIRNYDKNRNKGHWTAINSTVKHYHVDNKTLKTALAKRNKYIATINNEWIKLCNNYYEQNEAAKKITRLTKHYKIEFNSSNVIKMGLK